MIRVFISHSSEDKEFVKSVKENLERLFKGTCCFYMALEDPQPGRNLSDKVKEEINKSDIVLVLLTSNSKKSSYVNQEIGYAEGRGKRIIPVVVDGDGTQEAPAMLKERECISIKKPKDEIPEIPDFLVNTLNQEIEKKLSKQNLDSLTALAIIIGSIILLFWALSSNQ